MLCHFLPFKRVIISHSDRKPTLTALAFEDSPLFSLTAWHFQQLLNVTMLACILHVSMTVQKYYTVLAVWPLPTQDAGEGMCLYLWLVRVCVCTCCKWTREGSGEGCGSMALSLPHYILWIWRTQISIWIFPRGKQWGPAEIVGEDLKGIFVFFKATIWETVIDRKSKERQTCGLRYHFTFRMEENNDEVNLSCALNANICLSWA